MPCNIFNHFVLWEAVSQIKYCCSPKIKNFDPKKIFGLATPLRTLWGIIQSSSPSNRIIQRFNAQPVTTWLRRGFDHLKSVDCGRPQLWKALVWLPMKRMTSMILLLARLVFRRYEHLVVFGEVRVWDRKSAFEKIVWMIFHQVVARPLSPPAARWRCRLLLWLRLKAHSWHLLPSHRMQSHSSIY